MKRTIALLLAVTALLVSPVVTAHATAGASADKTEQAKGFIDNLGQKALSTIKAKQTGQMSDAAAKDQFRALLNQSFDIPTIAKATMGRYWRVATPAQQAEFTGLIKETIINKYADRVLNASTGSYTITGVQPIGETGDYAVAMTIKPTDGSPVDFAWRVRDTKAGLKVIDLAVEGISMLITNRSEFTSVIERNGGQVQALIEALKSKR